MQAKNLSSLVAGAVVMLAVAAYAQGTVTISVSSDGSSVMTSTGNFPVGDASLVGACSSDGMGGFLYDFGDGSASTFNPIQIPTTQLTAQFIANNPLGTGAQDSSGNNSMTLSVAVQLTGTLLVDVGPNCMTGFVSAPLSDPAPMSGTVNVTADQVFSNCNGQEALINQIFGIPGNVTVTFNETADTTQCSM
jgi:hypothetical protein